MSIPALVFLILLALFASSWAYLLWWAFRHGNRVVLLHSSGLVLLVFAIPLLIALYIVLVQPFLHASWPWSWVSTGLADLLMPGIAVPFIWVGIDLLWSGPKHVAEQAPPINWKLLPAALAIGCLIAFLVGFQMFGLTSLLDFLVGQGSIHIGLGTFSPDGFQQGFVLGICYTFGGVFGPRLLWWGQTFSERRWFVIGTSLLLLSIVLVAGLIA